MGEPMYIVTSPEDVLAVYKLPKPLDMNPFIQEILHSFGLTKDAIDKIYDEGFQNGKSYIDVSHDNFKLQMHPGEKLDALQQVLLDYVDKSLTWKHLSGRMVLSNAGE